jgi:electron transfer flavoprotein alpha subunit
MIPANNWSGIITLVAGYRDLAPTVASAMKCGLTADCTDLQIGDHNPPGTTAEHKNLLLQIRPAFGGNIIATIVNYDRWPQMATVREGVMVMAPADPSHKGQVIRHKALYRLNYGEEPIVFWPDLALFLPRLLVPQFMGG